MNLFFTFEATETISNQTSFVLFLSDHVSNCIQQASPQSKKATITHRNFFLDDKNRYILRLNDLKILYTYVLQWFIEKIKI